jgi:hypothetical protein
VVGIDAWADDINKANSYFMGTGEQNGGADIILGNANSHARDAHLPRAIAGLEIGLGPAVQVADCKRGRRFFKIDNCFKLC